MSVLHIYYINWTGICTDHYVIMYCWGFLFASETMNHQHIRVLPLETETNSEHGAKLTSWMFRFSPLIGGLPIICTQPTM